MYKPVNKKYIPQIGAKIKRILCAASMAPLNQRVLLYLLGSRGVNPQGVNFYKLKIHITCLIQKRKYLISLVSGQLPR